MSRWLESGLIFYNMFTGIIQYVVRIHSIKKSSGGIRLGIERPKHWKTLQRGESIAVDGVCLTLSAMSKNVLEFDVMAQTASLTNLSLAQKGSMVNTERSLRASDAIGGHFVAGHVDGIGRVTRILKQSDDYRLTIHAPRQLLQYCPARGSVAINGVSLTIAESSKTTITVALVDHTLKHTNLGLMTVGGFVNIEVDLIARYLEKMVSG